MLVRIILPTSEAIEKFVDITEKLDGRIEIYSESNRSIVYSGKSLIGVIAASAYPDLWCVADSDIRPYIADFLVK